MSCADALKISASEIKAATSTDFKMEVSFGICISF
jgi:hypothetical protein